MHGAPFSNYFKAVGQKLPIRMHKFFQKSLQWKLFHHTYPAKPIFSTQKTPITHKDLLTHKLKLRMLTTFRLALMNLSKQNTLYV